MRPGIEATTLTLVNVGTGDTYDQSTASAAGMWVAAEVTNNSGAPSQTTIVTSTDGHVWTPAAVIPNESVAGLVWGNGRWIAVAHHGSYAADQSDVLESTDLHTWQPMATVPDRLDGVAFGNGRWTAVGAPAGSTDTIGRVTRKGAGVVYTRTDPTTWRLVTTITDSIKSYGLDGLLSVGYGEGKWIAVAGSVAGQTPLVTYESRDGTDWTSQNDDVIGDQFSGKIGYGPGQWVIGASVPPGSVGTSRTGGPTGAITLSTDGVLWNPAPKDSAESSPIVALGYGNGGWLAVGASTDQPSGVPDGPTSRFFASADVKTWVQVGHALPIVSAVAFGGVPVDSNVQLATPSTTPVGPALPVLVIHPNVVSGSSDYGVIRPTEIAFSTDINSQIRGITWAYWTVSGALGHGTRLADNCVPNCADGVIKQVPSTIALSHAVNGQFTSLAETFNGQTQTLSGSTLIVEDAGSTPTKLSVPTSTSTTPVAAASAGQ